METLALPDMPQDEKAVFASYPVAAQAKFNALREIIFEEAARLEVGALHETLKCGEPAYLTTKSKAGSTIRMAWKERFPNQCTLFFNCNTDLVDRMREAFPSEFHYTGNREVSLDLALEVPEFPTRAVVAMALTYHRNRAAQ
jgi:hypothetical protein